MRINYPKYMHMQYVELLPRYLFLKYLLHSIIRISSTSIANICILVHSFAYDVMHIDPASELPAQEQPLIEEPDDREQESQQQEESSLPTSDLAVETADPTEDGRQDHAILSK